MSLLTDKTNLSSHVSEDSRGLGLISLYVSMHETGYAKYARVNAEGGLTFITNRAGGSIPSAPTLFLSRDEARIIATSLMNYLNGPGWNMNPENVRELRENLAKAERENKAMRLSKKATETDLATAREAVDNLKAVQVRYHDIMSVIAAFNQGARLTAAPHDFCS